MLEDRSVPAFLAPVDYFAGEYLYAQTGDFNGDAVLDVVSVDSDNAVRLLLGNGDGTFQPPVTSVTGVTLYAIGDVNADGKDDLVGTAYEPPVEWGYDGRLRRRRGRRRPSSTRQASRTLPAQRNAALA